MRSNLHWKRVKQRYFLKDIARFLCKGPTTISKEIRAHRTSGWYHKGTFYNAKNFCVHRYHCKKENVCGEIIFCVIKCTSCPTCNQTCRNFEKTLQSSGQVTLCLQRMLKENHPELNMSVRTLHTYLDMELFSARNIDLKRKAGFRPRKYHDTQISNRAVFFNRFSVVSATWIFRFISKLTPYTLQKSPRKFFWPCSLQKRKCFWHSSWTGAPSPSFVSCLTVSKSIWELLNCKRLISLLSAYSIKGDTRSYPGVNHRALNFQLHKYNWLFRGFHGNKKLFLNKLLYLTIQISPKIKCSENYSVSTILFVLSQYRTT